MRINPEDGLGDSLGGPEDQNNGPQVPPPVVDIDVQGIIKAAMTGQLGTARPLKVGEPTELNPMHINMILDRATGLRPSEIAQKYDMTPTRVSIILNHPYAEIILGAILARLADRITDPVERIRAYTHEAIDMKVGIMRDPTTPKALKDRVASDLLDRAGLGARNGVSKPAEQPQAPSVPAHAVETLAKALQESKEARAIPYDRYITNGRENGDAVKVSPAEGPGTPESRAGASPSGSSQEKVA